jgi:TolA-binding protein
MMRRAVLGLALVLAAGGCAYFNTFYSAKQSYAKAQKLERDSKTDRLSPEAIKFYDNAIEKSAKVIVEYGGGWRAGVDDALFLMGASYYGKRDYETAIGKFNELVLNYPKSRHVPEALFYTGLAYHKLRDHEIGDQIFANLLRQYPRFARRDEMLSISALGHENNDDDAGALALYQQLVEEFPQSRERDHALKRIGEIHFEAGRCDSALIAYQTLTRRTGDDQTYFDGQLEVGACQVRLGQYDDALGTYRHILPADPERTEQGGRVWLSMADAENRAGRYDDALAHLSQVIEHFANGSLAVEALFMKGYTYEVYRQDYAAARQAYQEAVNARNPSVFKDQASRRLENLARVEELAAADTARDVNAEKLADAALKVAEFSLLDGHDPARALKEYRKVVADYPDSKAAQRASYASAWILCHDLDSTGSACSVLFDLADRNPGSPQAKGAVDLLVDLGADSTRLAVLRLKVDAAQAEAKAKEKLEAAIVDSAKTAPVDSVPTEPAPIDTLSRAPLYGPALLERLCRPAPFDSLRRGAPVDTLPPDKPPEQP